MRAVSSVAGNVLIAVATALIVVAVTIPLFLNPAWVAFGQGRAEASAWTGFTEPQLRAATDSILADLVVGPPDFDVTVDGTVDGTPVLNERERGHMRDVRTVFIGFFGVALVVGVAALVIAARRRGPDRAATWRAVRNGATGLIAVLVTLGVVALVAFDVLFDTFHRLFFAGGTYTFDPTSERLVQLFPFGFWQETAIAVGVVAVAIAIVVALVADRRAGRVARAAAPPVSPRAAEAAR